MTTTSGASRPVRELRPQVSVRLLLALVVLLLAVALPRGAAADPQRGLLVVQGAGGTTSELVLARTVSLRQPFPDLSGGREYAAVLLEPVAPEPGRARAVGAVRVPAFRDGTSGVVMPLGFEGELAAGRYRVTLLGDGPVRAAFLLADQNAPGIVVRPRTPVGQQFLGRSELLPAGYAEGRVDLPGVVPAGRRVIQVGLFDGVAAEDHRMCATTGTACTQRVVPQCPAALPCPTTEAPAVRPKATTEPSGQAVLSPAQPVARALRWSTQGYREQVGRLRAAAIVF